MSCTDRDKGASGVGAGEGDEGGSDEAKARVSAQVEVHFSIESCTRVKMIQTQNNRHR
jgi:hypothetical protein